MIEHDPSKRLGLLIPVQLKNNDPMNENKVR